MSALARILAAQGNIVKGSDIESYVFTEMGLREDGIPIVPFQTKNFDEQYDIIIKGNAFNKDNNIEVAYLEKCGIEMIPYYTYLQHFLEKYTSFAVTGTHGKTTTTGLIAKLFENDDFAYLIGDGTGFSKKNAHYFVFESCEYKRHFLAYHPDYSVITNIEFDHPDYFKDLDDVIDAFISMVQQTKKKVIAFGDDVAVQAVISSTESDKFLTYGFNAGNDYLVKEYNPTADGMSFALYYHNDFMYQFELPFYGTHMLLNALAAIIVGHIENKTWEDIEQQLRKYEGVKRRFNVETVADYILIDDYAHHPTEIAVTLEAVKQKFPEKQIVAIFQPHTFTRTTTLADAFIDALEKSDVVYVTDIFASARETGYDTKPTILLEKNSTIKHLTKENIEVLMSHKNSVFVFMGAGDIQKYLESFKKILEK